MRKAGVGGEGAGGPGQRGGRYSREQAMRQRIGGAGREIGETRRNALAYRDAAARGGAGAGSRPGLGGGPCPERRSPVVLVEQGGEQARGPGEVVQREPLARAGTALDRAVHVGPRGGGLGPVDRDTAGQPAVKCRWLPSESTLIVCPGENSPRRMRWASGFSNCCWIARLSGRAP